MFDAMRYPKMLTLTVQNVKTIDRDYFKWIRGCFSKLRRRRFFAQEVIGGVYSIETTYNPVRDDWHVHIHCLIDSDMNIPRDKIKDAWEKITEGSWGVDIRRADKWALKEVLKYETKVADFVRWPEKVDEYLNAVKGSRLFHAFGDLFDVEEPEEEAEKAEFRCACGSCKWKYHSIIRKGETKTDEDGYEWNWNTLWLVSANTS